MPILARKAIALMLSSLLLSACGAWQSVSNGTADAFRAVFYKRVEVVHVDVRARDALNPDDAGRATSVVVRVYQLKDRERFDAASYDDLLRQDRKVLAGALQASVGAVVNPGASISLAQAIEDETTHVAVVAFFRKPGETGTWKHVVAANDLDADEPLKIQLVDDRLDLRDSGAK
ncbi:type VI secretion system-associated lipoprotein [Pandoraea cepalis]|uniref:Type VI secretion system-associated lipoprotein n=2 Tax=Pandoraea cepalis TaxID=2508294 RepID=A0A5E4VZ98_9BURK|nr:type VI secretion system-associated lipoprotein [Pandoraea cepalis]